MRTLSPGRSRLLHNRENDGRVWVSAATRPFATCSGGETPSNPLAPGRKSGTIRNGPGGAGVPGWPPSRSGGLKRQPACPCPVEPNMTTDSLPYRRTYGRVMVLFVLVAVPVFAFLPHGTTGTFSAIRAFVGTFGTSMAALLCPALIYAGLRTRCLMDAIAGFVGALTFFYWVPRVLLTCRNRRSGCA